MTEEQPLTPTDRDIAVVAALARLDAYIQQLAGGAEDGLGAPVTLLTSGGLIMGRLAPDRAMAEVIDELHEKFVEAGERSPNAEQWAGVRETIVGAAVAAADKRREERSAFFDRVSAIDDFDVLSVPEELGRETVRQTANPVLTVIDATVWPNGQVQALKIKTLRVHVAQVAAWWPANASQQPDEADAEKPV